MLQSDGSKQRLIQEGTKGAPCTKELSCAVKALDDERGLIEAYGSVFGLADDGGDIVEQGAFKRTIQHQKARVAAGKGRFLAPILWQHDPSQPIGGWYDLQEDKHGLLCKGQLVLTTQRGREVYELIKAGVINEFSIGYDIPRGGCYYDEKGYRHLTEIRLWEISPVTFAMNTEALLVRVKSACGATDLPLADRSLAWDANKAHQQIVQWATDDQGDIDPQKLQQVHFWYDNTAPDKITSYKLPFCYIQQGKPVAVPRGIFGCAAAIQGARGGVDIPTSDVTAVKQRIERYYQRMAKEFDDPSLRAPWDATGTDEQGGKASSIQSHREIKGVLDYYHSQLCADLIEDWGELYLGPLTQAIWEALSLSDPQAQKQAVTTALNDFAQLVTTQLLPQAQASDLALYLAREGQPEWTFDLVCSPGMSTAWDDDDDDDDDDDETETLNAPLGIATAYPLSQRSRGTSLLQKVGRAISSRNASKIQEHVKRLHQQANQAEQQLKAHLQAMKDHVKSIHTAADDLATILQGSEAAYGTDPGTPEEEQDQEHQPSKRAALDLVGTRKPTRHTGSVSSAPSSRGQTHQQQQSRHSPEAQPKPLSHTGTVLLEESGQQADLAPDLNMAIWEVRHLRERRASAGLS
jgi:HK97 family phage prohead protease